MIFYFRKFYSEKIDRPVYPVKFSPPLKSKRLPIMNSVIILQYSLPEETMATTMEVDVEELWTRTVASKPMTTPATGFERTEVSVKTSPACLPPKSRKAELRKLNEQMKRYNNPKRSAIFTMAPSTRRTLPCVSSST